MAAQQKENVLQSCLKSLKVASAQPERFLSVQDELASEFSLLTKHLYDFHKLEPTETTTGSPLKELVIENFDEEQIWQQLELQNNAILGFFKKAVGQIVNDEDATLLHSTDEPATHSSDKDSGESDEEESDLSSSDNLGQSEEIQKKKRIHFNESGKDLNSDGDSDVDFNIDELEQKSKKNKKTRARPIERSVVDDRFFKLAEMEAYLDDVEKGEIRKKETDADDIDYFEDVISDDDDDDADSDENEDLLFGKRKNPIKSSRDLHYKDYFDPVDQQNDVEPDGDDHNEEADSEESVVDEEVDTDEDAETDEDDKSDEDDKYMEETKASKRAKEDFKKVTFHLSEDSEGEELEDILGGKKHDLPEPKSSFEKRQEKMSEKIKDLEKDLLNEKSWQLRGEVTAQKRPENSLLEETLLFDHASRGAPVITEETTLELEDIIKQRIKDQSWDDVIRKEKPKEDAFEYKKRLTLDHEKSKLSLAELYEQEYVKLNQKKTEEENPKHVEIQKLMDSLFLKLDALSNFHFTPKPSIPEVKIVSNLPAITMEEVAPVHVSDAALLAPEEVKEKSKAGDLKADAEKTSTDKKRERRKKKLAKRIKLREKEKREMLKEKMKAQEGNKKLSKKDAAEKLKKLTKDGKATLLADTGKDKALKSSQAFFSQLQDQVKLQIKDAKNAQKKAKKQQELSAQKFKL
ncbi:hypothetical protein NDU88_006104 [Pleurodeles waltl]|uniref:U3 small nucleolar ribonucleoprotein protein MPP10 n=1 Tax=Pleurodeles waltl TaxID=8319 RepID=A0AAV7TZ58_PLEWA|nr:hypothetical protein NDU88_006104 [Pleurodeles waltl]